MNGLKKGYCRIFQTVFRMTLPFLPYREPEILGGIKEIPKAVQKEGCRHVLVVTGPTMPKRAYFSPLIDALEQSGIQYTVYSKTTANPTVSHVQEGKAIYQREGCDSLIAFGGGSPIDCAKAIGASVVYPSRSMQTLKGTLRVLRRIPLLITIPTTAGSGSETTLTAVITDDQTHHKYTMNSFPLIPRYAVLDPTVTYTLPKQLTATTGMDALTHAIEAYIGRSTTKQTRSMALQAVSLIFQNLKIAYDEPENEAARTAMLKASYLAGCAFSKSYVGYVHAVAHSLGGTYNIAHGLANAVLLPVILEAYGAAVYDKLYDLALAANLASPNESKEQAAKKLIAAIRALNHSMEIPQTVKEIDAKDIPQMAAHADKEANPLYPVPVLWDKDALAAIYEIIREKN